MKPSSPDKNLKQDIKDLVRILRRGGYSYEDTKVLFSTARKECGLTPAKPKKELPVIPSDQDIERLLKKAETNTQHWLIIKLLSVTGLRISELISIKKENVYLDELKLFIDESKTTQRYVLFPESLKLLLINQLNSTNQTYPYLFISKHYRMFHRSTAWKFIQKYSEDAGITKNIHPHSFRHYFVSKMTPYISESSLANFVGNKFNLDLYKHLSAEQIRREYSLVFQ